MSVAASSSRFPFFSWRAKVVFFAINSTVTHEGPVGRVATMIQHKSSSLNKTWRGQGKKESVTWTKGTLKKSCVEERCREGTNKNMKGSTYCRVDYRMEKSRELTVRFFRVASGDKSCRTGGGKCRLTACGCRQTSKEAALPLEIVRDWQLPVGLELPDTGTFFRPSVRPSFRSTHLCLKCKCAVQVRTSRTS